MKNMMSIGNLGMLAKKVGEEPIMTLFIKSIIRILQISKNEVGDIDGYVAISLLNTMLEQFSEKLDGVIILFVKILITELSNKEISKAFRLHVLQMVSYMLIYNVPLTLKTFTETNVMTPVFQNFFSSLHRYSEIEQFRNLIYGITCLITTDFENLPDMIKASMPKIVESLIKLMRKYTQEREREKVDEVEDQMTALPQDSEQRTEKNLILEKLKEAAINDPEEEEAEDDLDFKEDDDYLWSRTDSFYYKSKLEQIEAPLYFRDVLHSMKEQRPESYEAFIAVFSEGSKTVLDNIIQRCEYLQAFN